MSETRETMQRPAFDLDEQQRMQVDLLHVRVSSESKETVPCRLRTY